MKYLQVRLPPKETVMTFTYKVFPNFYVYRSNGKWYWVNSAATKSGGHFPTRKAAVEAAEAIT